MVRITTTPSTLISPAVRAQNAANKQAQIPNAPDDVGKNRSDLANRRSAYDSLGVASETQLPPGMPTPRDRDSEKIAYQDYSDKHPAAFNPPAKLARLQNATPFSADQITSPVASSKRQSIYDSLGVEPHQPPGVPTARERDSEKIAYQDYSDKHRVADNPPGPIAARPKGTPFSAEQVEQTIASGKRTSVYDSLNVLPHQPPGVPSPRDLDSEKIAYQDYSDKHPASFNPPAKLSRLQNATPFSPEQIARPVASGNRTSVYDSLAVDPHMPPGVPTARELDSEKIAYQDSHKQPIASGPVEIAGRPIAGHKKAVELDSNPLFEAPGDHGAKELSAN